MITYPLAIPGTIGPMKANLTKYDKVGESIGEFDGVAQEQQWQDQHWELELAWPEMSWEQFAPLDAFSGALFGKVGTFLYGPPLSRAPLGTPKGQPVIYNVDFTDSAAAIWSSGGICTIILKNVLSDSNLQALPGSLAGFSLFQYATWLNGQSAVILSAFNRQWSPPHARIQTHGAITFAFDHPDFAQQLDPTGEIAVGLQNINQAGSNQILTGGWIPNQPGLLMPADFFSLYVPDDSGISRMRLYQYIGQSALASDSGGNALIDFWPSLRETPSNGTPLILLNPQGEFRLATNKRPAPVDRNRMFTFQMKCREAI